MATITGTDNSETLKGTSANDVIDGKGGNDILDAGDGYDTLYGGNGNDILIGGSAYNSLYGGGGNDTFVVSKRTIDTYSSNDHVMDFLQGSDKIDVSNFGISSFDQITSILEAWGAGTYFNANYNSVEYSVTIRNIDKNALKATDFIFGTGGARDVEGSDYADRLFGSVGDDILNGKDGLDQLYGGGGNDRLSGGESINHLYGQAGNDIFVADNRATLTSNSENIIMDFTQGSDKIDVSTLGISSFDQIRLILDASGIKDSYFYTSYNNLTQSFTINNIGKDALTATDFVFATDAASSVLGSDRDDHLFGSSQNDTLSGKDGSDWLYGGGGNDTLIGGGSSNILYGQAGNDTFVADDRTTAEWETEDTIGDFAQGSDKIDVSGFGISSFYQLTLILQTSGTKDSYFNAFYKNRDHSFTIKNVDKSAFRTTDFILYTGGARQVEGSSLDDRLFASAHGDTLKGQGANDDLFGGAGADILIGGSGTNTLYGASGSDIFVVGTQGEQFLDTLKDFTKGSDKIDVSALGISSFDQLVHILEASGTKDSYFNAFYDDAEHSVTIKNMDNDSLRATDFIFDTGGPRQVNGSSGKDLLFGSAHGDVLNGGDGSDRLYGGGGNDTLIGGGGYNILHGQGGSDVFAAQDRKSADVMFFFVNTIVDFTQGNDKIDVHAFGISSFDQLVHILEAWGTKGSYFDAFYADNTYGFIIENIDKSALKSADFIFDTSGARNVIGSVSHDRLFGSGSGDTLDGNTGNDELYGGNGDDTLIGGGGADKLIGGGGSNTASYASAGHGLLASLTSSSTNTNDAEGDTYSSIQNLVGSNYADTLIGDARNNLLNGGLGNDVLIGATGNDILIAGGGTDRLEGGADNDTYVLGSQNAVIVDTGGIDTVTCTTGRSLANLGTIENLTLLGSSAINGVGNVLNNAILGNSGVNQLWGGTGNDTLDGGAGNDVVYGEAGNDTLYGGAGGLDRLDGGAGDDTYVLGGQNAIVVDGSGVDLITCSISRSIGNLSFIENLALTGTSAINGIGNNNNNALAGNSAANTLNGSGGNDSLNGGLGNDTLIGGTGADAFLFNTALNASLNVDIITDFAVVDDTIRLENAVFTALVATGTLSASLFTANTAGIAQDADDRIIYDIDSGWLYYDSNGNSAGGSVHFATIAAGLALTANDFFVV